jgi:hypothetical protein
VVCQDRRPLPPDEAVVSPIPGVVEEVRDEHHLRPHLAGERLRDEVPQPIRVGNFPQLMGVVEVVNGESLAVVFAGRKLIDDVKVAMNSRQ